MNRLLVLLLPMFIVGCEIENDNRIGLGMKVDFLVTSECMKSTIEHTQNTQNLITNGSSFSFSFLFLITNFFPSWAWRFREKKVFLNN